MGVYEVEIATSVVAGTNIANGTKWQVDAKKSRKIVRVGLVGSNAIRDTLVTVHYGTDQVMKLYNTVTAAGFTKPKLFWHTSHVVCPAGTPSSSSPRASVRSLQVSRIGSTSPN